MPSFETGTSGGRRCVYDVRVGVTVTEKLMRALGAVILTCLSVVVLACLVVRVLPALLLIGLVAWMVAQLVGWSKYRGF